MGANVLKIEGVATDNEKEKEVRNRWVSSIAEDRTARYLLVGKDEKGKTVYYLRFSTTGLRRRLFGPFSRKGHAIDAFDGLLCGVLQALTDAANEGMDEAIGNSPREMIELPNNLSLVK